jgi:2-oxoglutarate/2-oxoacid ferredoxin oxidoreductase subunit alpha
MDRTFAVAIGGSRRTRCGYAGRHFRQTLRPAGHPCQCIQRIPSIIRGGHTFLTIRAGIEKVKCFGDRIDLLIPLNQDSIDRHLRLMRSGSAIIYNSDTIRPGGPHEGVQLIPYSKVVDLDLRAI